MKTLMLLVPLLVMSPMALAADEWTCPWSLAWSVVVQYESAPGAWTTFDAGPWSEPRSDAETRRAEMLRDGLVLSTKPDGSDTRVAPGAIRRADLRLGCCFLGGDPNERPRCFYP